MNTRNTLLCISSYLDFQSLARLSQVNKLCAAVAGDDDLWRSETFRICATRIELYQVLSFSTTSELRRGAVFKQWRTLLSREMQAAGRWTRLDMPFGIDFDLIGKYVKDTLHSPELPLPRLTREGSGMETTTQALFAESMQKTDFNEESEVSEAMSLLYPHADALQREVSGHLEEELLLKARWVLRDSVADFKNSSSALLRIYYCLKKSVQAHCKLTRAMLEETESFEELLVKYCAHWSAFSAAANQFEVDFHPLVTLINTVYEEKWPDCGFEPRFSIVKFMTFMWRRGVFDFLQSDLLQAAESCIHSVHNSEKSIIKLQMLSQALTDLSVDEYSVLLLRHSQVQLDGPYTRLHELALQHTSLLADSLTDAEQCEKIAEAEIRLAERFYLPVTSRRIATILAAKELSLLQAYFTDIAETSSNGSSSPTENSAVVNTSFGLFLFELPVFAHQKLRVNHFINYLLAENPGIKSKIDRFNELSEACVDQQMTMEDDFIERKAKRLIRVPVTIPAHLRSTAHDLKRTDLVRGLQDCVA